MLDKVVSPGNDMLFEDAKDLVSMLAAMRPYRSVSPKRWIAKLADREDVVSMFALM